MTFTRLLAGVVLFVLVITLTTQSGWGALAYLFLLLVVAVLLLLVCILRHDVVGYWLALPVPLLFVYTVIQQNLIVGLGLLGLCLAGAAVTHVRGPPPLPPWADP